MKCDSPWECSWFPFSDEPVLNGSLLFPKFFNPYILMPEMSYDKRWHLFADSWLGIHHFVSTSGIAWKHEKILVVGGHNPSVYCENKQYYLVYEKHPKDLYFIEPKNKKINDGSSIVEVKETYDLISWSKPTVIFDSREVPFAKDYLKKSRLSSPQIIKVNGNYRLYFGASEIAAEDSGKKVPRYFTFAQSNTIYGSYVLIRTDRGFLESNPDDRWTNLGCGNIRIYDCDDAFLAMQCGLYWDQVQGKSHSAISLLKSFDGINFEKVREKPILVPSDSGWTKGYITNCDVHYKEDEHCWYCYFGTDSGSCGLMLGSIPPEIKKITESKRFGIFQR